MNFDWIPEALKLSSDRLKEFVDKKNKTRNVERRIEYTRLLLEKSVLTLVEFVSYARTLPGHSEALDPFLKLAELLLHPTGPFPDMRLALALIPCPFTKVPFLEPMNHVVGLHALLHATEISVADYETLTGESFPAKSASACHGRCDRDPDLVHIEKRIIPDFFQSPEQIRIWISGAIQAAIPVNPRPGPSWVLFFHSKKGLLHVEKICPYMTLRAFCSLESYSEVEHLRQILCTS